MCISSCCLLPAENTGPSLWLLVDPRAVQFAPCTQAYCVDLEPSTQTLAFIVLSWLPADIPVSENGTSGCGCFCFSVCWHLCCQNDGLSWKEEPFRNNDPFIWKCWLLKLDWLLSVMDEPSLRFKYSLYFSLFKWPLTSCQCLQYESSPALNNCINLYVYAETNTHTGLVLDQLMSQYFLICYKFVLQNKIFLSLLEVEWRFICNLKKKTKCAKTEQ